MRREMDVSRWPRLRAFAERWAVSLAALTTALVITLRTHLYFIRPYAVPVSNDEGYITAMALRLVRGHWLPYVDGVSQRGPITYWLCTLVMSIGGLFSWTTLRWFSLGLGLSTIALVFLLGLELFSPFAAGIAVLVLTYFVTYELTPWDGLGYNGELVAVQFVLLSALIVARVQRRPVTPRAPGGRWRPGARSWWLVTAGVLAACAGLSKQMALVHAGPALRWLVVGPQIVTGAPASRRGTVGWLSNRGEDVGWYLLGLVVPFAIVLTIYRLAGHLREFIYYFQQYGRQIFMAPLTHDAMRDKFREMVDLHLLGIAGVSFLALFAIGRTARAFLSTNFEGDDLTAMVSGRWARTLVRMRIQAPILFAMLHFVASVVGACFTWRFFGHYFIEMYPFFGLVAAYALSEPFEKGNEAGRPSVIPGLVVVAGVALLFFFADSSLHRNIDLRRKTDRWYQPPESDEIVRYVVEKTTPSDTIFVWGFRAEIYVSSRRYPASRFVYTVYPAGVVPWFEATRSEEERRVVPGSQQLLMGDLNRSQPELVVDAGRSMNGHYMYRSPSLGVTSSSTTASHATSTASLFTAGGTTRSARPRTIEPTSSHVLRSPVAFARSAVRTAAARSRATGTRTPSDPSLSAGPTKRRVSSPSRSSSLMWLALTSHLRCTRVKARPKEASIAVRDRSTSKTPCSV